MKLAELKLEALRIMNINNDMELDSDNYQAILSEKRYAKYLNNMFNSINRAIDIINHRRILPQKTISMDKILTKSNYLNNRYDLSKIEDFLSENRIIYEDNTSYLERVVFSKEGNLIVVPSKYSPESLILLYYSKIPVIKETLQDSEEIPYLSNELARIIPYYIKYDLYQEDEPSLALNAKNSFDQGLESLRTVDNEQEEFYIENYYSSSEV